MIVTTASNDVFYIVFVCQDELPGRHRTAVAPQSNQPKDNISNKIVSNKLPERSDEKGDCCNAVKTSDEGLEGNWPEHPSCPTNVLHIVTNSFRFSHDLGACWMLSFLRRSSFQSSYRSRIIGLLT